MEDVEKIRNKSGKSNELHAVGLPHLIELNKELFKVKWLKVNTLQEHIHKSIRKTKLATAKEVEDLEYVDPIPHPITPKEFKEFCERCPSTEMSRFLEKRIRRKIQARGLEESHPIILAELLQETKEAYSKVIHYACMNLKIKHCYTDYIFKVSPYKNVGRTSRYQEYLLIRKHLQVKWILHYHIVRRILRECVVSIPYELCHLDFTNVLDLMALQNVLKEKVKWATLAVYDFYNDILLLIDGEQGKQRWKTYTNNYLDACTGLISVHLSRAIAHTILHVVNFTGSKQNEPYLSLNAFLEKGLVIQPTAEDIIATYCSFVDDIINIGTRVYVLAQKGKRSYKNRYMPLCLTEEFVSDCKQRISLNILELYNPILVYIDSVSAEFSEIYSDINSEQFYDSISDIILDIGCEKIAYYKEYLGKAAYIPENAYFKLGQVSLTSYKQGLQDGLKKNIDDIFQRLSLQHLWEVTNLCETFELIHMRANQRSITTEELVETGKFMTWIKNEHLEELNQRVEISLSNLCRIIDLGVLSDEHLELNSAAIHWLDKSSPIIEEYFTRFEQLKYDAEEKLQKTVEDVGAAVKEVYPLLVILDDMDDITRVRNYLKSITLHMSKIKEIEEQISWINKEEVCLSFPKSTYSEYEDLKSYVYPFYHLLKLCLDVQRSLSVWQDGQFENLDYETTKSSVDKVYEELKKLHKSYREKLRRAQDENLPIRFRGTVDDPDILNWPAPLKLCGTAMRLIDDFKPSVEIMKIICNKALRIRHWKAMSEIARMDITPDAGTTLKKMMKVDFQSHLNEYEIISTGATKEKQLIDNLRVLRQQWEDIKFTISTYKQTRILIQLEDIEAIIDEHSIKIINMRGSVFVKPHEKEVKDFYARILRVDETVEKWGQMQEKFTRLFPIFSTGHLDTIIPKEADLFKKIRTIYDAFLDMISQIQIVIKIVDTTDILEKVDSCITDLEIIHSGVVTYLERVRLVFPRFYYLADDELLEIVSRKEPFASQTFLKKIFQEIQNIDVDDSQIMGMQSKHFERLKFIDKIDLTGERKVEELCAEIETQVIKCLKYNIGECFKVYKRSDITDTLPKFPQQALHIISQVYWTESIETAIRLTHNIKLRLYYQKLQDDLDYKLKIMNENDVSSLDRLKLKTLVVSDLNYRYLMKKILDSRLVSENQFDWEAHTKYYLEKGLCTVRMMNINQNYLYEYLGNPEPIVLTPLTDRCYRMVINAYYLHFNGLIQGPSESGKSQTIRALAAALGVFFIPFCCLREVESSTVSRLLKGIALCGSWICLENFNALKPEVLSVVSQDLYSIPWSKTSLERSLSGTSVKLNPTCFVCVTFNANRTSRTLPENVRVLFRTVVMITPDIERLAEVWLYCIGFLDATSLSKKLIYFFKIIQDILPAREHYYFGIKILRQTLLECEELKRKSPQEDEDVMVFLTLRNLIVQMLVDDDVHILDSILREYCPDKKIPSGENDILKGYIIDYTDKNDLQFTEKLYTKTIEVYNALKQTSGVILVGETFTAKTTVMRICEYVFNQLDGRDLLYHIVNPNSLDYKVLHGRLDNISSVWTDGVISKIIRDFSIDDKHRKWLVLDGNLDSSYIENVSSILDENIFYLESGEVLTLDQLTTVAFETETLNGSSPSAVSRCRLVYMDTSTLSWDLIVTSWIKSCDSKWLEGHKEQILDLLKWLIPPCLSFIANNCRQLCYPNKINLVKSMIQIIQMILDEAFLLIDRKEEDIRNLWAWIQATLIQAGVMGLGSILDLDSRRKFDEFYRQLWRCQNNDHPYPESFEKLEVGIPGDGLIFDYQFVYKQRGIWKLYQDLLKNEKLIESPYMCEFLVPTVDSLRYHSLLTMNINNKCSTLLVGPSSTGKSLIIEDILINRLNKDIFEVCHVNFSTNTSARQLQTFILSKLNKRKAGHYTPPSNKNFLLFIDNLSMTSLDKNGTSTSLELLRQCMDYKTWYDLSYSYPINLENVQFIAAMRPSSCSQRKLSQRFLRHFNTFSINEFPEDTVSRIYTTVLFNVWKKAGFPSDITTIISQIVSATIRIYNSIINRCKPTMTQCHYVFNLSNFTKVIKGISRLKKETYDVNKKVYLKLWSHEVFRVFGDRMSQEDVSWLLEDANKVIKGEFSEEEEDQYLDYTTMFGTIQDRELHVDSRHYEEIVDQKNLLDIFTECLKHYNYYHKQKMDLILFTYAVEKLTKICRIISTSPGNVLLLGSIGSERESLAKLASYIYNQKLFHPKITKGYTIKEWNRDLKMVLKEAGGLEKECMLLIGEEQLIDEMFLLNIDHLLTNGEIPDFYDADERQEILELARLSAQGGNRNLDISSAAVFLYFNKRCKENMHTVLCLNADDSLRRRIRNYPSLMNCHVIWCDDWPDESLESIAQVRMEHLTLDGELKEKVIDVFVYFHRLSQNLAKEVALTSKLQVHITSTAFYHLIKLFIELITMKQFEINQKKDRYSQGLAKLSYAANQILNMQKALANYQPQLEAMTQRAFDMTQQIALETTEVEKASDLVRKDENIACEQAAVAQVLKSECEVELAQAIPILEDAISALNTLKPSDITLVKSMKNPPDAIKLVMAAVCVIKDVKPDRLPDPSTGRKIIDYWGPSKRILGDMNFLQSLKDFDKDHIKDDLMVKIRKEYLPHKDFKPQVVAKASSAAEGLCKWIIAMDMYDMVAKEVAPKKEKLEKAEREYGGTMAVLNEKKEEVARLEEKLATLNDLLAEARQKQVKLQKEVDYCNKKLSSAQKLIDSLSGERIRWTEAVANLEKRYSLLVGDILLSSGIIAYLSPFKENERYNSIKTWLDYIRKESIPCDDEFHLVKIFASETKLDDLRAGLPNDNFFIENIIVKEFSQKYSIFIDPHYQASLWIQQLEKRNHLTITKFCNSDYLPHLKECITTGRPLLIHKIKDYIPPCLNQFLAKQIYLENDELLVEINDEYMKMDKNFRLYMVSNLEFPVFGSALYKRITIINFSLTYKALGDRLLKIVSDVEKPELKKLKKEVISQTTVNKLELLEIEEKILVTLCESDSDILEDEASIKILDQCKDLAKVVRSKQDETRLLENAINEFRNRYSTCSDYAAFLFYCISDLKKINVVYEFSLDWYTDLYFKSVLKSRRSKDINERCEHIKNCFTYDLYYNTNMSLFQKDKLKFLFLLTTKIMLFTKEINQQQLLFLLKCKSNTGTNFLTELSSTDVALEEIRKFESSSDMHGFLEHFTNNLQIWKQFLEKISVGLDDFPTPWNSKLNCFKKLVLIKILRKDQMFKNIKKFVDSELGERFTQTLQYNLEDIYNESYSLSPVLIFVTPGLNPMKKVRILVEKKKIANRFKWLPLGYNQVAEADKMIEEARQVGKFLFLQNCHLVPDWLQVLEQSITDMDADNTHEDFRLWMTTVATNNIPTELLQASIKITDEVPVGLKQNLLRLYNEEPISDPDFYSGCPGKQKIFSRLLYSVTFFHCLLEEKRKFGVFGWRTPYLFDDEDLRVSLNQLQLIVNEENFNVEFLDKLKYIIGQCYYSGKVDNDWDIRIVSAILHSCLNSRICKSVNYVFNDLKPYGLPSKNDYKDHYNYICKLPDEDMSYLFGISDFERNFSTIGKSNELIQSSLLILQDQRTKETQTHLHLLTLVETILDKLPDKLDQLAHPSNHVIANEVKHYNLLLDTIQNSLFDLQRVINGDLQMSTELEKISNSVLTNSFPDVWLKYSYLHQRSLSGFVENLCHRVEFFKGLHPSNSKHFQLSAFFFPRAILCKIIVDFSKENDALDQSMLNCEILTNVNPSPEVIIIDGLFSLGAKWDNEKYTLTQLSSVLSESFPPMALKCAKELNLSEKSRYDCPVYQIDSRLNYVEFVHGSRNFITSFLLPTEVDSDYWTKRGVKLVCQVFNENVRFSLD